MKAMILGICASFFFAFTFVLNSSMQLSGGSWIWSASLRFFFMIPFLLLIVIRKRKLRPLLAEIRKKPGAWFIWSSIGFGLFYALICLASVYSPGWLIAGTWQITIISGVLLTPFFMVTVHTADGPIQTRGKVPVKGLLMSVIILIGIVLMQADHARNLSLESLMLGVIPVLIASFAYPLGNRKMMEICDGRLDPTQRVLGMTLASLPFWVVLSLYGVFTVGWPTLEQSVQAAFVALFSGVMATVLFFKATELARHDMQKLASVEATQSMEVLFALIGEVWLLQASLPSPLASAGIAVVIIGMMLHSHKINQKELRHRQQSFD